MRRFLLFTLVFLFCGLFSVWAGNTWELNDQKKEIVILYNQYGLGYDGRDGVSIQWQSGNSQILRDVVEETTENFDWIPSVGEKFIVTIKGVSSHTGELQVYLVDERVEAAYWSQLSQDVLTATTNGVEGVIAGEEFEITGTFFIDNVTKTTNDNGLYPVGTEIEGGLTEPGIVFCYTYPGTSTDEGFNSEESFVISNVELEIVYVEANQTGDEELKYAIVDGLRYGYAADTAFVASATGETTYSGDIVIPSQVAINERTYTVTAIDNHAFNSCYGLTSIYIPESVTKIGSSAFDACVNLENVTIKDGLKILGSYAFKRCAFTSINLPNTLVTIENDAFFNCKLTSITIPNSVKSIGNGTFNRCYDLQTIEIPNSVEIMGNHVFYECRSLLSVTIPSSVVSIGVHVFEYCNNLQTLQVETGNPVFDSRNNCNAIIETASNTLVFGCQTTETPEDVVSIGESAFEKCSSLLSIVIPSGVTTIGINAFNYCDNLSEIICLGTTPLNTYNTFYNYDATLIVPCKSLDAYKNHEIWGQFATIMEDSPVAPEAINPSRVCDYDDIPVLQASGENITWYASDKTTKIGEGREYRITDITPGLKQFYVTQTINGCESQQRMISLSITPKPVNPIVTDASVCQGDTKMPTLTTNLLVDKWYADESTQTLLATGYTYTPEASEVGNFDKTYYVQREQNGCVSDVVPVVLHVIPKPTKPTVLTTTIYGGEDIEADGSLNMEWISNASKPFESKGTTYRFEPNQQLVAGTYKFVVRDMYMYDVENQLGCASEYDTVEITMKNVAVSAIPDMQITDGEVIPIIKLSEYVISDGARDVTYTAVSSDNSVVYPTVLGDRLGFVQYGTGPAIITVFVTMGKSTVESSFIVTINPSPKSIEPEVTCNLEISAEIGNITCFGGNDGSIEITVSGGVVPYQYKWNTGRTSSGIYGIAAGEYTVFVWDSTGCTATREIRVEEPAEIIAEETILQPSCGRNNGSISLLVTGGTNSYKYSWTSSNNRKYNTKTIKGLKSGVYEVFITDKNGCQVSKTFSLAESGAPSVSLVDVKPSKCNTPTGSCEIKISGGKAPYSIEWSDSVEVRFQNIRPRMYPGLYNVTVSDTKGCKSTQAVNVPVIHFKQPELSVVTYDKDARHNLVVWQKEETDEIDEYFIYRETEIPGDYEEIGSSPYYLPSVFVDETARFRKQSNRYRMAAGNSCWKSPLSAEGKTMILRFDFDVTGRINLWWDAYEGSSYISYTLYRVHQTGVDVVETIPANRISYTAPVPPEGTIGYYVAIQLNVVIDINTPMKSESGPFAIAISNIAELEKPDAVSDMTGSQAIVYGKGKSIVIANAGGNDVFVSDITGKIIAQEKSVESTQIDVQQVGVYIVVVGDRAYKVLVD
ncbi:MAG: leucine-rich repeat protein [Bacteroidales bacterium]|nr:leucine-rich repeat protein [Bacteroidales bacterium]